MPAALLGLALGCGAVPLAATAQGAAAPAEAVVRVFNIAPGPLDAALDRFARVAGVNLSYDAALLAGLVSKGLSGSYGASAALAGLLSGSGIEALAQPGGGYVLRRAAAGASAPVAGEGVVGPATLPTLTVTAAADASPNDVPKAFAGGQVARGASAGVLGNRDYMQTPFSISSYTDQTVRDVEARTRLQVLELDPSVIRATGAIEAQDQFLVRGFAIFGFQASVDGMTGLVGTTGRDAEMYERIELTKGPSALLNGAGSAFNVGGTVNLVTKYAHDAPLTQLNLRYAEESEVTSHLDIGRRFGPDNAFGVRANLVYGDGKRGTVQVGAEPEFRRQLYSLALDYRGDTVRFKLHTYRLDDDQSVTGTLNGFSLEPQDPTKPVRRPLIGLRDTPIQRDIESTAARVEWDLMRDTTATLSYGHAVTRTIQPYAAVLALDPATGDATVQNGLYADWASAYQVRATVNARFSTGPVSHQLGVDATRSWARQVVGDGYVYVDDVPFETNLFNQVQGPAPSRSLVQPAYDGTTKPEYTYAIADTLGFFDDRLQLTAGVRRVERSHDTSPSFALLYALSPQASLYANYIEGVQERVIAPANTSPLPEEQIVNPGEEFGPTPTKQKEIGAKFDFGGVGVTAALFQIEQVNFYVDPATRRYGPLGLQRNRGAELNVFGEPWKGVRLLVGYAFVDAKLKRTEDPALQGNTAAGVPRHTLTLSGSWAVPSLPGLGLALRSRTQSRQFVDETNAQRSAGYTLLSGGASYATRLGVPVVFRLSVENVNDKHYYVSFGRGRVEEGMPRTFMLSAQIDL